MGRTEVSGNSAEQNLWPYGYCEIRVVWISALRPSMCSCKGAERRVPPLPPETVAGGAAAPHGVRLKSDDSMAAGASDATRKTDADGRSSAPQTPPALQ